MSREITVFVSSTSEDLGAYREAALHVCRRLGLGTSAMEAFGPDPRAAVEKCRDMVHAANVFLVLVAHRYGFQPDGYSGKSICELEYEWAIEARLPVLAFLVDEELPWPPRHIDRGDAWERLQRHEARLRKDHVVAHLSTPDKLREDLFVHLPRFVAERPDSDSLSGRLIPTAPEPYVEHPYTLLNTSQVVGRRIELQLLDDWIRGERSSQHGSRVLCLVAIGGMGKSAVSWKWFNSRVAGEGGPAGRIM